MKAIKSTLLFFSEVGIGITGIIREVKKAIGKGEPIDYQSEQIEKLKADVKDINEIWSKMTRDMAYYEGLIDEFGQVTKKGKTRGVTTSMIQKFKYSPEGLN